MGDAQHEANPQGESDEVLSSLVNLLRKRHEHESGPAGEEYQDAGLPHAPHEHPQEACPCPLHAGDVHATDAAEPEEPEYDDYADYEDNYPDNEHGHGDFAVTGMSKYEARRQAASKQRKQAKSRAKALAANPPRGSAAPVGPQETPELEDVEAGEGPGPGLPAGQTPVTSPATGDSSASTSRGPTTTTAMAAAKQGLHVTPGAAVRGAPFVHREAALCYSVQQGHVHGMYVPAKFYASPALLELLVAELGTASGGFTAAVQQLANVATLPGVVGASIGMPDLHSGYGFAIGNVAATHLDDPAAVVSPGGVGFDINCGVRLLRSDLKEKDINRHQDLLADALYAAIPVGVGEAGTRLSSSELEAMLRDGMKWAERSGYCWAEDLEVTEEQGCFAKADPAAVSSRAKARGQSQCGSLGSGNHYVEVQVVDEVFDQEAADVMGIGALGTVCIMIHSGSRGLGHQVCTDFLAASDRAMAAAGVRLVDRQLACMPVASPEGQQYLKAMGAAANFAFCNRTLIAHHVRTAFAKAFGSSAKQLHMHQVYDVSHNIAKEEEHTLPTELPSIAAAAAAAGAASGGAAAPADAAAGDRGAEAGASDAGAGRKLRVLVHRKGATRAFAPGHPEVPEKYRSIGQPVLIGGSMGTSSYVLVGTEGAMRETFGSTCHGAGRAVSRSRAMKDLDSKQVLKALSARGIAVRMATKKLAAEEAPESYKDVSEVVDTCHAAGISKKVARLRPVIVVKG